MTHPVGLTSQQASTFGATALRVRYGDVVALADVSLTVARGQVTAVVGGDGAGKTSLMRCLAGAVRPEAGEVRSPGRPHIGYLPASSGLYPDLTVTENLAFRAAAYGMTRATVAERGRELIAQAGLTDARDRLAGQLSGGMRQKLGVIAALLHRPELLILDEPSTGVDPVSRSGLWSLITGAAAAGAAVILATTYIDDAQRASNVLVLDAGRQLAAGRPEEIVAAMPGSLLVVPDRPAGAAGRRAWRRGASWRVWCPPGTPLPGAPVAADLQDAVTVAALARELRNSDAAEGRAADGPDDAKGGSADRHAAESRAAESRTAESRTAEHGVATAARERRPADIGDALCESRAVTRVLGQVTAVREVSMQVRRGEIVGLIGANGAGKTTLIRLLLGLIPVTSGQVLLLGEQPNRQTRRRIGYVPQGLGLYDDLTVDENLQFAAAVFGSLAAADVPGRRTRGESAQTDGELAGLRLAVGQLPLGLQRRAAFAEALAHEPELLILDEPTSGVDPLGRARLWQTISGAAHAGAGALVSTHYMEEAGECDRLIIMAAGAVVAAGTAAQIIGAAQTTIVAAADWRPAFSKLERAGLPVTLAGQTLRVPSASPDAVRQVLAQDAGRQQAERVYPAPATLEERFFELTMTASQHREPA